MGAVTSLEPQRVGVAVGLAGVVFALLALFGSRTRRDLSGWGPTLMAALLGSIIAIAIDLSVLRSAGVLGLDCGIFAGFVAHDTAPSSSTSTSSTCCSPRCPCSAATAEAAERPSANALTQATLRRVQGSPGCGHPLRCRVMLHRSTLVVLLGVMACTPDETSTGATTQEPSTSTSTGAPSTDTTVTPTTGEPTPGTSTTEESTSSSSSSSSTTTSNETTSTSSSSGEPGTSSTGNDTDAVACVHPWTQPTACTNAACQQVTRTWVVCDASEYDGQLYDYRFAADDSVLTYLFADEDPAWDVRRITPDGQEQVLFHEVGDDKSFAINPTGVNFWVYTVVRGNSVLRLISNTGEVLGSYLQSFCGSYWLVPDSATMVRLEGVYQGDDNGCKYTDLMVVDEAGQGQGSWVPDPSFLSEDLRVNVLGAYYPVNDPATTEFVHRGLDGKIVWKLADFLVWGSAAATQVDRQIVVTNDGVRHLSDGVLIGAPALTYYDMLLIAPHGVFSVVAARYGNPDKAVVQHFVEGQLDWSSKLGFYRIHSIDVSDRGEVAVMAVAEDATHWIALFDPKGELAWKAQVQAAEDSSGVRFSASGDALVVRERDFLSMFTILR